MARQVTHGTSRPHAFPLHRSRADAGDHASGDRVAIIPGSPKVHVGHFASLTLGGGSSMLVSQSMIPPMSADAEWRQSLRIRPPAFRL